MDEKAVTNEVISIFSDDIDKNPNKYFEDAKKTLAEIAKDVNFYMDEEGVNLYFQLYDLAPYAAGYPQLTVPFEGNEQMYKIDLTGLLKPADENADSKNAADEITSDKTASDEDTTAEDTDNTTTDDKADESADDNADKN